MKTQQFDTIIIGGGASGLMAAITAGKRGQKVCVLDHADKLGKKILISGGGRCNFTNTGTSADRFISKNKHFAKSALAQFTQNDFIDMIKKHNINYHEKTLGQLFCDDSASQIIDMLLTEARLAGVKIILKCEVEDILLNDCYLIKINKDLYRSKSLIMATGGLSIPKIGATNFGYKIAHQFNLAVEETAPALVPFTFNEKDKAIYESLSGIAFNAKVTCGKTSFTENILFTHRGISGPAILQISSYWKQNDEIKIHIMPELDWEDFFKSKRQEHPKQELRTVLSEVLQKRFVNALFDADILKNLVMVQVSDKYIAKLLEFFTNFTVKPNGTEGYRKAEVTIGGISTKELNAKTLECKNIPGLYFIGELVDVTGWLGGYNFQWAWSSGFAAGNNC